MHTPYLVPTFRSVIAYAALALLISGCNDRSSGATPSIVASSAASPAVVSSPVPDKWLGKWFGPEGTMLQLAGGHGKYEVTIESLDGPRVFQGNAAGDRIEFERDGVKESVRATNGTQTGMKWLTDKSNCLTVHTGEGYCRD